MNSSFENLPLKVLKRVISYLPLNDILSLMTTSDILYDICNSNDVWKSIFNRFFKSFCSVEDCKMSNNNWRDLCLQIMIENEDREEFQEFLMSYGNYESDSDDESVSETHVRLSIARTNLLQCMEIHDIESDDENSSSESGLSFSLQDLIDIKEIYKTVSSSSTESFSNLNPDNSSKTNLLLVPTSSSTSFNENAKCHKDVLSSAESVQTHVNMDDDKFELGFTRSELKRRLQNLVKLAHKNFNGDVESLLPASKYGKFALRYRDE